MDHKAKSPDWDLLAGFRFLMASVVLCGHVNEQFLGGQSFFRFLGNFGLKAGVVGFFVVSGFSIAASLQRNPDRYYRRRFSRIYPVYLFAVVAALLLQTALDGHLETPKGLMFDGSSSLVVLGNTLLLQTFLVKPIGFNVVVWSLAVEFSYYVVAPLLPRLPRWAPLVVIAVSALSFAAPRHDDWGPIYYGFSRFNMLEWAWAWFMGFFLFHNARLWTVAGFAVLGSFLMWQNTFMNPEPFAVITFLAALLVVSVARFGRPLRQTSPALGKVFSWLGDISYPLYVIQYPIFIAAYGLLGISDANILIALCVVGAIPVYYSVDVYFRRWLTAAIDRRCSALDAGLPYLRCSGEGFAELLA